jgi:hypothetical protein
MASWKPIPGFENYEASDEGRVRCTGYVMYRANGRIYPIPPHEPHVAPDRDGYLRVRLMVKGHRVRKIVHRLVAMTHIPNPGDLPQINHIDGNKQNNSIANLEWTTSALNHWHRRHVLKKGMGEGIGLAKLRADDVRAIRASSLSHADEAKKHGVSPQAVGYVRRGQTWRHVE